MDNKATFAFEIDVSKRKTILKAMGLNKQLDCYPILWVYQAKELIKWTIHLKQRIACQYLAVKLLDIHRINETSPNIDMFALELNGFPLGIPKP